MHFWTSPTPIGCMLGICLVESSGYNKGTEVTSVQAGAVLMPLTMFLLLLKSIRVLY